MFKKTITYVDYNGETQTDDFYFNLSTSDVIKLQTSVEGGFDKHIRKIVDSNDQFGIVAFFEDLIRRSYGVKSEDGKKFLKSEEISNDFMQSAAYEELFNELTSDADKATEFTNSILAGVTERSAIKSKELKA